MTHVHSFQVGALRCHAIQAGIQQLDGGAMFGVVPKPLWEKRIPADPRNRIRLGMRNLLIESDAGLILVDTGVGNKEDPKFHDIYGIDNAGADGRTWLEDGLAQLGYRPEDVDRVVLTHLHFDHAGGCTMIAPDDAEQRVQAAFPKARYLAHRREVEYARSANERTRASYFPRNYQPLIESGQMELIDGPAGTIVPGVRMMVTPGHTPWHMVLLIESQGAGLLYPGDTVPTAHHLPLPWIMGYDVEPLRTLESKRALYFRGMAEGWQVCFEHDADTVLGRLVNGEKGPELVDVVRSEA